MSIVLQTTIVTTSQTSPEYTLIGGNISIDKSCILGTGGFSVVFRGKYGEKDVAVKRIMKTDLSELEVKRSEEATKSLKHENIARLFTSLEEGHFKYYVFELCESSLTEFLKANPTKRQQMKMPSDYDCLLQLTKGLRYIHSQNFVHRNIHTGNVLICPSDGSPSKTLLKISGFMFSKSVKNTESFSLSGIRGRHNYLPPELLLLHDKLREDSTGSILANARGNVSCDVFALGCLFFTFLAKDMGKHPFKDSRGSFFIPMNIRDGKYNLNMLEPHDAKQKKLYTEEQILIEGMIQYHPDQRWKLDKVQNFIDNLISKNK